MRRSFLAVVMLTLLVGCGVQQRTTDRRLWEYKVHTAQIGTTLGDAPAAQVHANQLGREGWELVAAVPESPSTTQYIFKRPVSQGTK